MIDTLRQPVTGARAWRSADFAGESAWLTTIDAGRSRGARWAAAAVLPDDPHRWTNVDAGDVITDSVADTISWPRSRPVARQGVLLAAGPAE